MDGGDVPAGDGGTSKAGDEERWGVDGGAGGAAELHGILRVVRRVVVESGARGDVSAERVGGRARGVSVVGRDADGGWDTARIFGAIGDAVRGRRFGRNRRARVRRVARVDARDESVGGV